MNAHTAVLDPKRFGFFIKCLRTASNLSQDAVALASNVDVRTVQRVEGGQPTNITTRRCLARGLGYEDRDVFEKPEFAGVVNQLFDAIEKSREEEFYSQFPGTIRIKTYRVMGLKDLERVAEANAYSFSCDPDVSDQVRELAASIFDSLRDIGDIIGDVEYSESLRFLRGSMEMVEEIDALGADLFFGARSAAFVGAKWEDKTSIDMDIGYLVVVPKGRAIQELLVSTKVSFR